MFKKLKKLFLGSNDKNRIFDLNEQIVSGSQESKKNQETLTQYKNLILSMQQDKFTEQGKLLKLTTIIAVVELLAIILLIIAIMNLIPLKEIRPYIVSVDSVTGRTEVTGGIDALQDTSVQERIDAANIASWLTARESYNWFLVQKDLLYVQNHSTAAVFQEMHNMLTNSKTSPVTILGEQKMIKVLLSGKPVIKKEGRTATVRFVKSVCDSSGNILEDYKTKYFLATLTYDYNFLFQNEQQRLSNPLGFQVTSCRIEEELTK